MHRDLIPVDKYDILRARNAIAAGYPGVESVLAELLAWLQDMNWPVARELAPFLASVGLPLMPHLTTIVAGDDQVWKYHLIRHVIAKNDDLKRTFQEELRRLAIAPSAQERQEELQLVAREALVT